MKNRLDTSWRERQRSELRAQIYEAALALFRTQGFGNTSVQQIASAVGIGKGTFFNHFPSKDHVLQAWYREITRTALEETTKSVFASGRDAVLALTTRLAKDVSVDPYLWDAKAGATSNTLLKKEEDDLDQEVLQFCKSAIERDIADGRLTTSTNAEFLVDMVLTVITGTAHSWSVSNHRHDLPELINKRVSFVLDAVSPPKGTM
jgi:AcrR family transcriptional regulator